jgi:hypothetical protein
LDLVIGHRPNPGAILWQHRGHRHLAGG